MRQFKLKINYVFPRPVFLEFETFGFVHLYNG